MCVRASHFQQEVNYALSETETFWLFLCPPSPNWPACSGGCASAVSRPGRTGSAGLERPGPLRLSVFTPQGVTGQ